MREGAPLQRADDRRSRSGRVVARGGQRSADRGHRRAARPARGRMVAPEGLAASASRRRSLPHRERLDASFGAICPASGHSDASRIGARPTSAPRRTPPVTTWSAARLRARPCRALVRSTSCKDRRAPGQGGLDGGASDSARAPGRRGGARSSAASRWASLRGCMDRARAARRAAAREAGAAASRRRPIRPTSRVHPAAAARSCGRAAAGHSRWQPAAEPAPAVDKRSSRRRWALPQPPTTAGRRPDRRRADPRGHDGRARGVRQGAGPRRRITSLRRPAPRGAPRRIEQICQGMDLRPIRTRLIAHHALLSPSGRRASCRPPQLGDETLAAYVAVLPRATASWRPAAIDGEGADPRLVRATAP